MQIDWDVPIEARDGLLLRADVYRPGEDGRYPVILSYGVYGKGVAFQEGYPGIWERLSTNHPDVPAGSSNRYQAWEVVDPEKWVPDGYVCVRVDSRGAGRSPGLAHPLSPKEAEDFYDCIEWAGVQEWSNGRVGLSGISYYAINQWQVAELQPPHLAAMIPWEGAADFYRDMTHHGGMRTEFFPNWFERRFKPVQHGLGSRGFHNPNTGEPASGPETLSDAELARMRVDLAKEIRAHPIEDEFYTVRSPDWSKVKVPFLSAGNWGGVGLHLRGNTEAFLRAASEEKWLEVHNLEHWTHYYTDYGVNLQKRFFDYYLKGEDNGWDRHPRVMLDVRHVDRFEYREEHEWPLARTRWTPWYLDASGSLSGTVGEESSAGFAALESSVTFRAAPAKEEVEITGPVAVKLFVSSTSSDADIFVVLRLLDPDGEDVVFQGAVDPNTPIGQGWLRASHRQLDEKLSLPWRPYHTHEEPALLEPGRVYELDVEVWPTSIVVPPGHQLALTVMGVDWEHPNPKGERLPNFANELRGSGPFLHRDEDDRPPELYGGTTTIHCGADTPSHVLLPIIPEA